MAAIKLAIIDVKVFITWEMAFESRTAAEADVLLVVALKNIAWRSCALAKAPWWVAGAEWVSFIVHPLAAIFKAGVSIHPPMELVVRAFEDSLAPAPEVLHDEEDAIFEGVSFIVLEGGLMVHETDAHGHLRIDESHF